MVNTSPIQPSSFGFSPDGQILLSADQGGDLIHLVDASGYSINEMDSLMPVANEAWQIVFHPERPWLLAREESGGKLRLRDYGEALVEPVETFPPNTNSIAVWNPSADRLLTVC